MMTRPNEIEHRKRRGRARATVLWVALGLGTLAAFTSAFTVEEGEVVYVARFGDMRRLEAEPGLHFRWPAPIDTLYPIDMRTHVLDPDFSELLTADQKQLEVDAFVAWKVSEPLAFVTNLQSREGADERIRQALQSASIRVFQQSTLDDVVGIGERDRDLAELASEIEERVRTSCAEYGYGIEVVDVGIERVTFPADNMPEIEERMRAERNAFVSEILNEAAELLSEIETAAIKKEAEIRGGAITDALTIRGKARAEASRIEQEAAALNPELYTLLTQLEIMKSALRGQLLVLTSDSPLLRALVLPPPPPPTVGENDR